MGREIKTMIVPGLSIQLRRRFWSKVEIQVGDGCWGWRASRDKDGYGQFGINRRMFKAHRVAYSLVCGAIPTGLSVLHKCDNPACCKPNHLFVGTAADNARDKAIKGRAPSGDNHHLRRHPERILRGESNGGSKLTREQVLEIRRKRATLGTTQGELGKEYGVSRAHIGDIISGRRWAHLECGIVR